MWEPLHHLPQGEEECVQLAIQLTESRAKLRHMEEQLRKAEEEAHAFRVVSPKIDILTLTNVRTVQARTSSLRFTQDAQHMFGFNSNCEKFLQFNMIICRLFIIVFIIHLL